MTTSHRVDGLAFLNDDVVGECKHNRQIHKNNQVPQWGMMKPGSEGSVANTLSILEGYAEWRCLFP